MRLEMEITHRCNKNCELCDHRIATSPYDYLTWRQFGAIVKAAGGDFDRVLLIGGEPLVHPFFQSLAWEALERWDRVRVATNGKLLPRLAYHEPVLFDALLWTVQQYPGWNDETVIELGYLPNVKVRPYREFWNPYVDPKLDEETARQVAEECLHQVRLVGTKLYRCCLSEGVERYYQTEPVHVEFSKGWHQDWEALPVWKACQHCFRAWDTIWPKWRWR